MLTKEQQLTKIQRLKPKNTQAYYWYTYDNLISCFKDFCNKVRSEIESGFLSEQTLEFLDLFQQKDFKDPLFWREFNSKQTLMKYVVVTFGLIGDLKKQGNKENYKHIQSILLSGAKNEQGMMVYGLIKSINKSYANALYHYNIATALFYGDRNSLSEICLTSQEQYDKMEQRILEAFELRQKEVVSIDAFMIRNDDIVIDAIKEFFKDRKRK